MAKEKWSGKIGVILAVAGSAVGLGNFLRFPGLVAENGGGAFMIPYIIAFVLLGLPLCWIEWTLGRFGGKNEYHSAPGIFNAVAKGKPWAKYLGILGVIGPLGIVFYYIFIESWTLAYAWFAVSGKYTGITDPAAMESFFGGYLSGSGEHFSGPGVLYLFFLITFTINFAIIYRGLTRGIEAFNKLALPVLFIAALVLVVRVLTLGAPVAEHPEWNVNAGLGFMWNPQFDRLKDPTVWLKAAGQIFFTLSVGIGVILTYSSYVKQKQDIALSSLTAGSVNGFAEVIIGGSIVVVAAVCFFGIAGAQVASAGSIFKLGFISMPMIFNRMNGGEIFGFYWFFLLFLAGITSSISLLQPAISFLEHDCGIKRKAAILWIGVLTFVVAHFVIFKSSVIDELDFWFSSFGLPLFGMIQIIFFVFIIGIDKGWSELHEGAEIKLPRFFRFVIRYVTPLYLGAILISWAVMDGWKTVILKKTDPVTGALIDMYPKDQLPWIWGTRTICLALILITAWLIHRTWKRKNVQTSPVKEA
jgi:neurotransmitter:Na+ symporter, NSS family